MNYFVKLQPRMFESYRKPRIIEYDTVTGHKLKHRYVVPERRSTVERQPHTYTYTARSTSSSSKGDDVEDDDSEEDQDNQDDIPARNIMPRHRN